MADAASSASSRDKWLTLVRDDARGEHDPRRQTSVTLAILHVICGLDASLSDGQWVLTANILPLAAFMVLGGRLGDLLGLRRVFLVGAIVFAAASALAGAAQSLEWLIVMRAVQGRVRRADDA